MKKVLNTNEELENLEIGRPLEVIEAVSSIAKNLKELNKRGRDYNDLIKFLSNRTDVVESCKSLLELYLDAIEESQKSQLRCANVCLLNAVKYFPDELVSVIEEIIDAGQQFIDVNYRDSKGVTPLMYAARAGKANFVKCLLKNNADVLVKDRNHLTALDYAYAYEPETKEDIPYRNEAVVGMITKATDQAKFDAGRDY